MSWQKKGQFYIPKSDLPWRLSHAQLPVVDQLPGGVLRVYFGTRDKDNRTVTTFIEVEADDPKNILYEHDQPVLGLGELGTFDDNGVMPSWLVDHAGQKYLYYIGWNRGVSVSYRNSIGIAVSDDGGCTFRRLYKGPIVDRTPVEPHFCGASCVLIENGFWRMWYLSGTKWIEVDGNPEPIYDIKYAESLDGIHWRRAGITSIPLIPGVEGGVTRPCVIKENGVYRMWYSYRGFADYRSNPAHSYRIGYAESDDGIRWARMDSEVDLDVSETGWDSEMITYAHVYIYQGDKHMIYNGNGFGRTGLGHAIEIV